MNDIDVTKDIRFGDNDGEYLPITKCVCGEKFNSWDFSISIYNDMLTECPKCNRKFYFRNSITIYEVIE